MNSSAAFLYEMLVFCGIAGFAVYDIKSHRVPNRAVAAFCLIAAPSPVIHALPFTGLPLLLLYFLYFLMGAATGFLILLSAAVFSKSGSGVGGGDIKLAAVMGFIYGPLRMIQLLLIASALASAAAFIIHKKSKSGKTAFPFVPFLAAGSLAITIASLMK